MHEKYYDKHKEKILAKNKIDNCANPEKRRQIKKLSYQKNKHKYLKKHKITNRVWFKRNRIKRNKSDAVKKKNMQPKLKRYICKRTY